MEVWLERTVKWLLGPEIASEKSPSHLWPRWFFLRALGLIYFSAFYSLLFQIKGMMGPNGLLPARDFLQAVAGAFHWARFWYAPTVFWVRSGDRALMLVCWAGLVASVLILCNVWPRATLAVAFVCFISFVTAAQVFSGFQSDDMLLEAGFISLFFAPPGLFPGLGRAHPASRASLYMLRWEWFRIYFESGVAKIVSHDYSWRHFTAMDDYYQNAPLPTWIGWYVGHLPHWFHASAVFYTLAVELLLAFMVFLPRRFRTACFFIVAPFQISIILTGNYTFLNYLVFLLGFLLLDDRFVEWIVPQRLRNLVERPSAPEADEFPLPEKWPARWRRRLAPLRMAIAGVCFASIFYVTAALLCFLIAPSLPLPEKPIRLLAPLRIASRYGLFANMTHERREIEFQGSMDGVTWTPYLFRYKPQDPGKAPGIYAPYQPRFEWDLWFASLGAWPEYHFVLSTQERLLQNEPDVLALFANNPFPDAPPLRVRAVVYRYWFTDMKTKRETGMWWQRELLGDYSPPLEREPDGRIFLIDRPTVEPPAP